MRPNCRKTVFKFTVPVITFTLILLILEMASRFYAQYFYEPTDNYDFRIKKPAPYKDAEFFSKEFVEEMIKQPASWNFSKNGVLIPGDFKGKYFNTKDGMRKTSFQPSEFEHTIHMFGGSTMYCGEVPDEHTIASYLQKLFNEKYPGKYLVKNYGVPTLAVSKQLLRLEETDIKKNDIVIFYDGVNEIFLNLYYANRAALISRVAVNNMNIFSWMLKFMLFLSDHSFFIRLFFNPVNFAIPNHLNDNIFMEKMLNETAVKFKRDVTSVFEYKKKQKSAFFHFLQPHFFSDKKMSTYEKELYQNQYLVLPGADISFKAGYPVLQQVSKELRELNSFDLTHILDKRPDGEEFYLDNVHVNHKANRVIAQKMFFTIANSKLFH